MEAAVIADWLLVLCTASTCDTTSSKVHVINVTQAQCRAAIGFAREEAIKSWSTGRGFKAATCISPTGEVWTSWDRAQ